MKSYLASPYTNKDQNIVNDRVKKINKAASELMSQGHIVFSPISHSHHMALENDMPTTFEFWQEQNHAFIDWCDSVFVLMLPVWTESKGVADEIEYAIKTGKPVYYISE